MSDQMTSIPFGKLMEWILAEHEKGTIFGVRYPFTADPSRTYDLFGRKLETPFGPAAGPHTQLAQNIVAAYAAGARFFELKTVQVIDGADLKVEKPCIKADDEGYNVEWSTELTVANAQAEYIKAWIILHVLAVEYGFGAADGFQFNMSVGYDLKGIQTKKIDDFIETMKDASHDAVFRNSIDWLKEHADRFSHVTAQDIDAIPAAICNSVTVSTMHGCPPDEIERIAMYLMNEKGLHTFVKCNPTLLGYEFARQTMDALGYTKLVFTEEHFKNDLQYADAVPMLKRLQQAGAAQGLLFGVKLTNTFPVTIKGEELPGEEMYMSGKPLFFLAMNTAKKLTADFDGTLRISYCGGADAHNIKDIVDTGIWPVTVATTLLKPGGYERFRQFGRIFAAERAAAFTRVDGNMIEALLEKATGDSYYKKAPAVCQQRKTEEVMPIINCFMAPCNEGCPIHQDITTYMQLVEDGNYAEALQVIMLRNPLPFITGTICYHRCMNRCTRNFCDEAVDIRKNKLLAAEKGYKTILGQAPHKMAPAGKSAAVIGGGPAGLAAAYFLARGGINTTVFEKEAVMGGVVRSYLCDVKHKISADAIEKDVALIKNMGVHMINNWTMPDWEQLQKQYQYIVLAVGAADAGLAKRLGAHAGEAVPAAGKLYTDMGLVVNENGHIIVTKDRFRSSKPSVYVIGDGMHGVSSVVECIRDAGQAANAILGMEEMPKIIIPADETKIFDQRGILAAAPQDGCDNRCLHCDSYCETCVEVCPNRANIAIKVPYLEQRQILHIDYMCNECGNCRTFCPWKGAPYQEKWTLFANERDMSLSHNPGITFTDKRTGQCKVRLDGRTLYYTAGRVNPAVPEGLQRLIAEVFDHYKYLLL
jgi:putative selenate reductase